MLNRVLRDIFLLMDHKHLLISHLDSTNYYVTKRNQVHIECLIFILCMLGTFKNVYRIQENIFQNIKLSTMINNRTLKQNYLRLISNQNRLKILIIKNHLLNKVIMNLFEKDR